MNGKELYVYIENCIKSKFSFLYDLKYQVVFVDYEHYNKYSKKNDFRMKFENNNLHRYLEFCYKREKGNEEIVDIFDLRIDKEDGHSGFFIENYMLFIQKQEIKYLWLNSFEGTFEEKLDQLLGYVVDILQTYLMPVLKGEEWVDVPMNWYGTK
jgi:hypothetical protein